MIEQIRKRSGELVEFQPEKITCAIYKAATAVGGKDWKLAEGLTEQVLERWRKNNRIDRGEMQALYRRLDNPGLWKMYRDLFERESDGE